MCPRSGDPGENSLKGIIPIRFGLDRARHARLSLSSLSDRFFVLPRVLLRDHHGAAIALIDGVKQE
jgi:hypothetical protein